MKNILVSLVLFAGLTMETAGTKQIKTEDGLEHYSEMPIRSIVLSPKIVDKFVDKIYISNVVQYDIELLKIQKKLEKERKIEESKPERKPIDTRTGNKMGSHSKYLSLDLRNPTTTTVDEINRYLVGTNLEGLGQAFVNAETKYNVNAKYLMAHAILESGWGESTLATTKNNLYGFQAYDGDVSRSRAFATKIECIDHVASYVSEHYLKFEGKHHSGFDLTSMNVNYASDDEWDNKIASIMVGFDKEINLKSSDS